jgi:hypothetical protein
MQPASLGNEWRRRGQVRMVREGSRFGLGDGPTSDSWGSLGMEPPRRRYSGTTRDRRGDWWARLHTMADNIDR